MPIATLLQQFIDDELDRSAAFVAGVLTGTVRLLKELKDSGLSPSEGSHCVELIAALQKQAELYQSTFTSALRIRVAEEIDGARRDAAADATSRFGGLELMDESLVDADIEISRAMQLIDATAEWELRELQTFTSTLIGQSHVSAESNPLRPLVYATALWQAACAVTTPQVQRTTLLRLSSGVAAGLLKNAWAAASSRLEAQGIQPGAYRTLVLPGAGSARTPAFDVTRPGALSGLLAKMSGGSPEDGRSADGTAESDRVRHGAGTVQGSRLGAALLRLDELLRQPAPQWPAETPLAGSGADRLAQHRAALVESANGAGDRQIIELLSRIFEAIHADPALPAAFRPVVARMQVASFRVALQDPVMMDSHHHEVWRLMDRLGEAGTAPSQAHDPQTLALLAFCDSLVEEIARTPAPDAALFRRALQRLETFLGEQLQDRVRAAKPAIDALELAERRTLLEQQLTRQLAEQVPLRTSPGVRRFVTGSWARVIAEAMLRFGEDAEPTRDYLKTVDDLLWSLYVPDHRQSRQRLLALLPVLLGRLRSGMELIALPRPQQQAVLDELMTIHTEALRPGSRTDAAALGAEEIVQRIRDEVPGDASGPRPFGDSVIDLSSMETVPAELLASDNDASAVARATPIDKLRAAQRLRIFLHGHWNDCRLLWRSDHGLFFLFAGESASRTHSITRAALERLNAAGLVLPVEAKPLLQRAVDKLMREIPTQG